MVELSIITYVRFIQGRSYIWAWGALPSLPIGITIHQTFEKLKNDNISMMIQ